MVQRGVKKQAVRSENESKEFAEALNEPIIVPTYEKVLKRMGRISKRS
jgi:hypothetical protein